MVSFGGKINNAGEMQVKSNASGMYVGGMRNIHNSVEYLVSFAGKIKLGEMQVKYKWIQMQ